MPNKDLKYFMRDQKEEIVTAPAPKGFVDDEGNQLEMEIKVLTNARIQEIFTAYRKRSVATNEKGVPYLSGNGEVVFKTERDSPRAVRHIIAEALVFPDLQDKKLMDHYKCVDITDMPNHVFSKADEYSHVSRMVFNALGIGDEATPDGELIDSAKN